jgi:5'(3')-deoxyribonucleotidase
MIYVDMDGVLCDFLGAVSKLVGKEIKTHEDWAAHRDECWPLIAKEGSDFWKCIKYFKNGRWLIAELCTIRTKVVILSAYPTILALKEDAIKGKRAWLLKNITKNTRDTAIFCPVIEKQNYAKPGDVLIDDNALTIEQWNSRGGIGIYHENTCKTLAELKRKGVI